MRTVTMVLNPLSDIIEKLDFFSSYECLLSKVTVNSDSQRLQKIPVTQGIKVRQ